MSERRDGMCYYCGKMTVGCAGNPGEWPVMLCHADDPGVVKHHHVRCVSERLAEVERLTAELDRERIDTGRNAYAAGREQAAKIADRWHESAQRVTSDPGMIGMASEIAVAIRAKIKQESVSK